MNPNLKLVRLDEFMKSPRVPVGAGNKFSLKIENKRGGGGALRFSGWAGLMQFSVK